LNRKIEAFNLIAGDYDKWYKHPQGKQIFEAELEAIRNNITYGIGLEIGAGTGIFAEKLHNFDRVILCLDPSQKMIRKAMERNLPCIIGLGESLPIRVGSIDFCYMVTVIEFIDNPVILLKEIRKVSKNETMLILLFINSDSDWGLFYRNIGEKGDTVFQHANLYTLNEVFAFLNESGYDIQFSKGILQSSPLDQVIDKGMVEPSKRSGVLIIKAQPYLH
jgi:SAM-dependent methyltransferase